MLRTSRRTARFANVTLVTGLVVAAGCTRRAEEPAAPAETAPGAAAPASAPPAGGSSTELGTPAGPITPRTQAPAEARALSSAFAAVAKALRPSVVRIDVEIRGGRGEGNEGAADDDLAPFFRRFFGQGEPAPSPVQHGTGSGVLIDAQGDIVTNRHVVTNASRVQVTLIDGRELTARTLGMDPETDVAVIRLDKPPADLVAARLGDSDKLEVGEWVLAVGSPLGLDQTVTAGIVSGKGKVGRHVQMSGGRVRHYIQTDAKINPGNSGGPLVNLSSEVVGINTLINTGPGGAYGFAIPINQVRHVANALMREGRVRYAYLGVLVGDLDAPAPDGSTLPRPAGVDHGALVSQATPGGPAARAGVRAGDVITELDGRKMEGAGDVIDYVSTRPIGSQVKVDLVRDGHRQSVPVVLGELPSEQQRANAGAGAFGMSLQTLTPDLAQSLGLDPSTAGAVVAEIVPGGPAAAAGVAPGDVLLEIDRQRISTADQASAALSAPRRGGHLVRLRGPNGIRFVTLGGN